MKINLGKKNILYPMPVTLIGTIVNERVNFLNIAHIGIFNASHPHKISLGMAKSHYSNAGIIANKCFSVNIMAVAQMKLADYAGLVSGKNVDKSGLFEVFYGELANAPMIVASPLTMECRLIDVYDVKTHDVMIGEVVNAYSDESVMSGGSVDLSKVDPLLFDMASIGYWSIGKKVGDAWHEGKELKKN